MILNILKYPDKRLRTIAKPVISVDETIQQQVKNMFETMYDAPGIGLAATQVNFHQRIIVIDISDQCNEPICFINPKIIEKSGEIEWEEGCLSVPGQFAEIERPSSCDVEYLDYNGNKKLLKASGLLATCIQHEMDHLEGILFIDYLSKLKRSMITKKLSKQKKELERIVV